MISAVGHEPDVTISDFVADLRAATPSNAAELAVPDQDALRQTLDELENAMAVAMNRRLISARERLEHLSQRPVLRSPLASFDNRRKTLRLLESRLVSAQNRILARQNQRYVALVSKLDAMSPLKVLTRGYAVVSDEEGHILRSVGEVTPGDNITVRLSDGEFRANAVGDA